MFFKIGLYQLWQNKKRFIFSVFTVALGVSIIFGINITTDVLTQSLDNQVDYQFGNVDYTVYRSDNPFLKLNSNNTISDVYLKNIKQYEGVENAVSRLENDNLFYKSSDVGYPMKDWIVALNCSDPDEMKIGTSIITECISGYDPNSTHVETLLNTTKVTHPLVISKAFAEARGISLGEIIYFIPQNATLAYATVEERAAVVAGTITSFELETQILANPKRFESFTVVGILIDASEGPRNAASDMEFNLNPLSPSDRAIYIDLDDAYNWVFNLDQGQSSFFLLKTTSTFNASSLVEYLESFSRQINPNLNIPFAAFDVKALISSYTNFASTLIRFALNLFSMISIIMCAQLIKTTMQMNINDKFRELGILMSMGFRQRSIFQMSLSQLLIISSLGTSLGLIFGMYIPLNLDTTILIQSLSTNEVFPVVLTTSYTISITSFSLSIIIGFSIPILFGLIPLKKMRNWKIVQLMNPVYMQLQPESLKSLINLFLKKKKSESYPESEKRLKLRKFLEIPKFWQYFVIIIAFGISLWIFYYTPRQMFALGIAFIFNGTKSFFWFLLFVIGMVLFMVGITFLIRINFSSISKHIISIFKSPLGLVSDYLPQIINANSRRTRNLISNLLFGMILISSILTFQSSIELGGKNAIRTYFSGDIVVYSPMIQRSDLESIKKIDGVADATTNFYAIMDSWKTNSPTIKNYLINKVDSFGGRNKGINQSMNFFIIEPVEYLRVNGGDSIFQFSKDPFWQTTEDFILQLDTLNTIIIEERLATSLSKKKGDNVSIEICGLMANLKIVGIASLLPGSPFMLELDTKNKQTRSAFFSRETLQNICSEFVGNVDIIIKNNTIDLNAFSSIAMINSTNLTIPDSFRGYSSGIMDRSQLSPIFNSINAIENISYRFSTFVPNVPLIRTPFLSDRLVHSTKSLNIQNLDSIQLPYRLYLVDPANEYFFTGSQQSISAADSVFSSIKYSSPFSNTPQIHNTTVDEILYTLDKYGNYINRANYNSTGFCIVNQYVAKYDTIDKLSYVYEIKPNDLMQISLPINETVSALLNFTVMGTTDNHLTYVYANGTERAGYKFSSKSLNYNINQNFTLKMDNPFTEGLDVEGNVFLTTYNEIAYQLGQYMGTDIAAEDMFRLTNHVYLKIASKANVTEVVNSLNQQFSDAGLLNLSVCAYKQYFLDSLTEIGSLTIKMNTGYNYTRLISDLKDWYTLHNYTWRAGAIGQSSMLFHDLTYFPMIYSIINLITIFSLIMSFIGLCMVTYDATQKQSREFGIIKSIGFKNKDIHRIVLVQMFLITFSGVPLGLLSSILMMNIVLGSMNSSLLLPYVFSVPWGTLLSIGSVMTAFSILAAYWTATSITKQPILHAFRFRN